MQSDSSEICWSSAQKRGTSMLWAWRGHQHFRMKWTETDRDWQRRFCTARITAEQALNAEWVAMSDARCQIGFVLRSLLWRWTLLVAILCSFYLLRGWILLVPNFRFLRPQFMLAAVHAEWQHRDLNTRISGCNDLFPVVSIPINTPPHHTVTTLFG